MIRFDETYMSAGDPLKGSRYPGFGASNRTPGFRGVERTPAKAVVPVRKSRKGLARSCVAVVRKDNRTQEVYVKGSGVLLGTIRRSGDGKSKTYLFKRVGDERVSAHYPSVRIALDKMLEMS